MAAYLFRLRQGFLGGGRIKLLYFLPPDLPRCMGAVLDLAVRAESVLIVREAHRA